MTEDKKHLYNLDELTDYKVADGYPNVKGWNVKDKDNRVIGEVENLLVNLDSQRVVYLDVEVDKTIIDANYDPYSKSASTEVREFINKDGENHVIIPIGLVDINESQKHVFTDSIDHQTFAETKRYKKGTGIDREYERAVLDSYRRNYDDEEVLSENKVRAIVREEVEGMELPNKKELEFRKDRKVREIVRDEVTSLDTQRTRSEGVQHDDDDRENRKISSLAAERRRLKRDDFKRRDFDKNDNGMDFDHDNDGNPNITDPDYYDKDSRSNRTMDFDRGNDGNPNVTDIDDYDNERRSNRNTDFDHDNDGNPNITDPDYYEKKGKGRKNDDHDNDGIPDDRDRNNTNSDLRNQRRNSDEEFYDGREFRNKRF